VPCRGARADKRARRGDGVVDPVLLQGAFRVGFVILILSLLVLPFEDPSSAEFVAALLAVIVGLLFVAIVTVLARSSLPPPPRSSARNSVDKATGKPYYVTKSEEAARSGTAKPGTTSYNGPDSRSGGNR
jgi:hypothetical protein